MKLRKNGEEKIDRLSAMLTECERSFSALLNLPPKKGGYARSTDSGRVWWGYKWDYQTISEYKNKRSDEASREWREKRIFGFSNRLRATNVPFHWIIATYRVIDRKTRSLSPKWNGVMGESEQRCIIIVGFFPFELTSSRVYNGRLYT